MNTEDMDYYEYEESKKRFTPKKMIGFFFKLIVAIIIIGTFALILIRSYMMNVPEKFEGFTFSDATADAYNKGELTILLQSPPESFDDLGSGNAKGLYNVSNFALCKETSEVQVTFRYNSRSTISKLMSLYALTEKPSGEVFVFTLTDDKGNEYTDYSFASFSRPMNEFRRLIFTDVDLGEITALYLNIYYGEDVSDASPVARSLMIYSSEIVSESPDGKAKPSSVTFSDAPYYDDKRCEEQ